MKKLMEYSWKYLILFVFGGGIYYSIEILFRGYSHWSMFLLGGICFLAIDYMNRKYFDGMQMALQMLLCSAVITMLEFIAGTIVNLWLDWNVWNYAHLPLHLFGQISLLFSFFWYLLSYPAILLNRFFHKRLFNDIM